MKWSEPQQVELTEADEEEDDEDDEDDKPEGGIMTMRFIEGLEVAWDKKPQRGGGEDLPRAICAEALKMSGEMIKSGEEISLLLGDLAR